MEPIFSKKIPWGTFFVSMMTLVWFHSGLKSTLLSLVLLGKFLHILCRSLQKTIVPSGFLWIVQTSSILMGLLCGKVINRRGPKKNRRGPKKNVTWRNLWVHQGLSFCRNPYMFYLEYWKRWFPTIQRTHEELMSDRVCNWPARLNLCSALVDPKTPVREHN